MECEYFIKLLCAKVMVSGMVNNHSMRQGATLVRFVVCVKSLTELLMEMGFQNSIYPIKDCDPINVCSNMVQCDLVPI